MSADVDTIIRQSFLGGCANESTRAAAVGYGREIAARLLTKGRVERHLSKSEIGSLIAVAFAEGIAFARHNP